jgi:hypothetical protein
MTTPLSTLLSQIREADEKATKGPWVPDPMGSAPYVWGETDLIAKSWNDDEFKQIGNRDLIALYRTVTPLLAKMLEEAVETIEYYRSFEGLGGAKASVCYHRLLHLAQEAINQQKK